MEKMAIEDQLTSKTLAGSAIVTDQDSPLPEAPKSYSLPTCTKDSVATASTLVKPLTGDTSGAQRGDPKEQGKPAGIMVDGQQDASFKSGRGSDCGSVVDLCQSEAEQSKSRSTYRPTYKIPTFEELSQQGIITLRDPTPGSVTFPGTFNTNGEKVPFKELYDRPHQQILPSATEPLWKQMLAYCQRWGVWVTNIEDDTRRLELIDWVTKTMRQSWEFAIANGHCGEPNGHQQCCLSHEQAGVLDRKPRQQKEIRNKAVDIGAQPAPFASENAKHMYSIANCELEQAGITMQSVLERVTPEGLKAGDLFLKDMCGRLGRNFVDMKDWTTIKKFSRFFPRIHSRNLLMFCLWEVQRCRTVVNNTRTSLTKSLTQNQQRNLQNRIDVHQQRADQHLALALILNERLPDDDNDDRSIAEDQVFEEQGRSTRSGRHSKLAQILEITSDDNSAEQDIISNVISTSTTPELASPGSSEEDSTPSQQEEQTLSGNHGTLADSMKYESALEWNDEQADSDDASTAQIGRKRDRMDLDENIEPETKKRKFQSLPPKHGIVPDEPEAQAQGYAHAVSLRDSESASDMEQITRSTGPLPQQADIGDIPIRSQQPLQDHAQAGADMQLSSAVDEDHMEAKQWKQRYTLQYWQPYIDELLMQRGFGTLKWHLQGWGDIKRVLEQMEFNPDKRNQMLREYKAGFVAWKKAIHQQPASMQRTPQSPAQRHTRIILQPPQVPASNPNLGPTSLPTLESSRSFSFRYFSNTTTQERNHVDDMIGDYISAILHARTSRYGFYAVFIMTGDPSQKELAHGVWNLRQDKKIGDAAWFYENLPRPSTFRADEEQLYHDWGYSVPPPQAAGKRTKVKGVVKTKTENNEGNYFDDDDDDEDAVVSYARGRRGQNSQGRTTTTSRTGSSRTRGVSRTRTGARTISGAGIATSLGAGSGGRKRRRDPLDDSDEDDEWKPEY